MLYNVFGKYLSLILDKYEKIISNYISKTIFISNILINTIINIPIKFRVNYYPLSHEIINDFCKHLTFEKQFCCMNITFSSTIQIFL